MKTVINKIISTVVYSIALCLVATVSTQAQEGVLATDNTALQGSAGVSPNGAATYSIPIDLPASTNGIKPELSINYNSQGGVGELGLGFSLGGLPAVLVVDDNNGYHDANFYESNTDAFWDNSTGNGYDISKINLLYAGQRLKIVETQANRTILRIESESFGDFEYIKPTYGTASASCKPAGTVTISSSYLESSEPYPYTTSGGSNILVCGCEVNPTNSAELLCSGIWQAGGQNVMLTPPTVVKHNSDGSKTYYEIWDYKCRKYILPVYTADTYGNRIYYYYNNAEFGTFPDNPVILFPTTIRYACRVDASQSIVTNDYIITFNNTNPNNLYTTTEVFESNSTKLDKVFHTIRGCITEINVYYKTDNAFTNNNKDLLWKYELSYNPVNVSDNFFPRLSKIIKKYPIIGQANSYNACEPITIDWSKNSIATNIFVADATYFSPASAPIRNGIASGDYNGDGKTDLIYNYGSHCRLHLNTSTVDDPILTYSNQYNNTQPLYINSDWSWQKFTTSSDYDNDGRDDIMTKGIPDNSTNSIAYHLYKSVKTSTGGVDFIEFQNFPSAPAYKDMVVQGDISGDGQTDILYLNVAENAYEIMQYVSGTAYHNPDEASWCNSNSNGNSVFTIYFYAGNPAGNTIQYNPTQAPSNGYENSTCNIWSTKDQIIPIKFNTDAYTDFLLINRDNFSPTNGKIYVSARNNTTCDVFNPIFSSTLYENTPLCKYKIDFSKNIFTGDFNADGITDLLAWDTYYPSNPGWVVLFGNGTGFRTGGAGSLNDVLYLDQLFIDPESIYQMEHGAELFVQDINRDGYSDIIEITNTNIPNIPLSPDTYITPNIIIRYNNHKTGYAMFNGSTSTPANDLVVLNLADCINPVSLDEVAINDFNNDGAQDLMVQGKVVMLEHSNKYLNAKKITDGFGNATEYQYSILSNVSNSTFQPGPDTEDPLQQPLVSGDFLASGCNNLLYLIRGVRSRDLATVCRE